MMNEISGMRYEIGSSGCREKLKRKAMKAKNCEIDTLIKDEDDGEDADEDADDENQLPVEMRKYIYTQNPSQLNHPPTSPLLSLKPISESSRALTNLPIFLPHPTRFTAQENSMPKSASRTRVLAILP